MVVSYVRANRTHGRMDAPYDLGIEMLLLVFLADMLSDNVDIPAWLYLIILLSDASSFVTYSRTYSKK